MKKIFILSLAVAVFTVSCKKSTSSPASTTPATVTQSFTAVIGGNNWTAATVTGTIYSGYINITATASDGSTIILSFPQVITAWSSAMGSGTSNNLSYRSTSATNSSYTGFNGTLVITSNANNVVQGSYSGLDLENGNNTIPTIYGTSGSFVAKY